MSDHIDAREGWTEIPKGAAMSDGGVIEFGEHGRVLRMWVRVPPVPPLPTAPYTVIRVAWRDPALLADLGDELRLRRDGLWGNDAGEPYTAADVAKRITAWEPLAEPRAVTAKAVLDRVNEAMPYPDPDRIAREFGVES